MIPKCDQCDSAVINGVYCHEPGCPNREKFWDEENEMWMDIEESTDEEFLNTEGENDLLSGFTFPDISIQTKL